MEKLTVCTGHTSWPIRCSGKTAAELPTWPNVTCDWIDRIFMPAMLLPAPNHLETSVGLKFATQSQYRFARLEFRGRLPMETPSPPTASVGNSIRAWTKSHTSQPEAHFAARTFLVLQQRSEEHTSELQSRGHIVCRLLLEKKNK